MLVLLSAPRGRVSAARVALRARERERAEAQRVVIRLPRGPEPGTTADSEPRTPVERAAVRLAPGLSFRGPAAR